MIILALVPALLLSSIIFAGFFLYRDEIVSVARSLQNKNAFTPFSALPPREAVPIIKSGTGDEFAEMYLGEAMSKLVTYVKAIEPDWLVGVHPGGRLVSVLLAEQVNFPPNRCLYVRTSRTQ